MHDIITSQPNWESTLAPRILLGLWHPRFLPFAKHRLPYCRRSYIGYSVAIARKYFWQDCHAFSISFASLTTTDGQKFVFPFTSLWIPILNHPGSGKNVRWPGRISWFGQLISLRTWWRFVVFHLDLPSCLLLASCIGCEMGCQCYYHWCHEDVAGSSIGSAQYVFQFFFTFHVCSSATPSVSSSSVLNFFSLCVNRWLREVCIQVWEAFLVGSAVLFAYCDVPVASAAACYRTCCWTIWWISGFEVYCWIESRAMIISSKVDGYFNRIATYLECLQCLCLARNWSCPKISPRRVIV